MTAKEKAKELFDIYECITEINYTAKQCALIAVDEIIHYLEIVIGLDKEDFEYWQQVKQEIDNL
jgi:hypothetical protein